MQANYLRQLNQKGDPEAVIRQYEGGRINSTEATLGEYVKALVKVDRLDSTALAHTLQVFLLTNLIQTLQAGVSADDFHVVTPGMQVDCIDSFPSCNQSCCTWCISGLH